jgi:ketol-acid reductoisomerase
MADIYKNKVAPNLRSGMTLCFAHGFQHSLQADRAPQGR